MKPSPRVQEVGAYEAKTHLPRLLRQTRAGKSFIITQRGKPVAELKPVESPRKKGAWGDLKGKLWISDDFCDPIEEMKDYMP